MIEMEICPDCGSPDFFYIGIIKKCNNCSKQWVYQGPTKLMRPGCTTLRDAVRLLKEVAILGDKLWDEEDFRDGLKYIDSGVICDAGAWIRANNIPFEE